MDYAELLYGREKAKHSCSYPCGMYTNVIQYSC
jgi:hypothetical protein